MSKHHVLKLALDRTEGHFRQEEARRIEQVRARAKAEQDQAYAEEHICHCFRCGTETLAEVEFMGVTIDICVNDGCGATHLDKGELEKIMKNNTPARRVMDAIADTFKSSV